MNQTKRSTNRDDYQYLPQPVVVMARDYVRGHDTAEHHHPRAQLIYARSGVMKVFTEAGSWVIPPQRAVWVPGGMRHRVIMVNEVQIRTLYVLPDTSPLLPTACTVVEVSTLLRELIYALLEEPLDYAPDSRGALISQLILSELRCLRTMPLHLPMPKDARLVRLCQTFIDKPGTDYPFEQLAETAGASTRTLARLFQAETGMSFRTWRQQVRLIEALGLLAQGLPVGQVACALGYRSQSAFSAMFQRALGVEPSRYFASGDSP